MAHELLPDFYILIINKSRKVIYVIAWFIEIFYGHWIWIPKANKVLKDERIVLPKSTPKDGSQSI